MMSLLCLSQTPRTHTHTHTAMPFRLASLELVETNAYSLRKKFKLTLPGAVSSSDHQYLCLYTLERQRQGTMVVSDSHAKHMPRDRIIPSSQLRLLNSVGQGKPPRLTEQPLVLRPNQFNIRDNNNLILQPSIIY